MLHYLFILPSVYPQCLPCILLSLLTPSPLHSSSMFRTYKLVPISKSPIATSRTFFINLSPHSSCLHTSFPPPSQPQTFLSLSFPFKYFIVLYPFYQSVISFHHFIVVQKKLHWKHWRFLYPIPFNSCNPHP